MKNNAINNKKEEKYFFDANIFDEDHVEELPEPPPPPPPMFSEEEIAAARAVAMQEGRKLGVTETEQSHARYISEVLERIAADTAVLFAAEKEREKMYEQDALRLCLQVFEKLFPLYNERYGFAELQNALALILKKQEGQQKILVSVSPDAAESIEKQLQTLKTGENGPVYMVKADPALPAGACRLAWHEGGAGRDPDILAGEIRAIIEQALAGTASKGHDRESSAPAAQAETVEKPV